MVGLPIARRIIRRHTASPLDLRLMRAISPVREAEGRRERYCRRRETRRRASARVLRSLKEFFGVPVLQRNCRPRRPAPLPEPPIVILSGESFDEEAPAEPRVVIVDLSETYEELPDLNPAPRRATLQQAALRQAYVVLRRLDDDQALPQLPVLHKAQHQELPLSVDWNQLEYALAEFDYQPSQQVEPVQQGSAAGARAARAARAACAAG